MILRNFTRIFLVLFLSVVTLCIPYVYKKVTLGFRLEKCSLAYPFNPRWEFQPADREIKAILEKPFTLLGSGKQAFVFANKETQTVIKLYYFNHSKLPFRIRDFWSKKKEFSTLEKAAIAFDSTQVAFERAKELTGILFVHLNPKQCDLSPLLLIDRLGRRHFVDPSKYRFVLQKKIDSLSGAFEKSTHRQELVSAFYRMIDDLGTRGLAKYGGKFITNYGFLNGTPMVIDFGSITHSSTDTNYLEKRFGEWIANHYPELEGQKK